VIIIIDVANINDFDDYEIKFLDESFLEDVLFLQNTIMEVLTDQKSYYVENVEFFCKQLANKDSSIGLFQKDQLVGFNIASFPGMDKENLGIEVGLKQEELSQVAEFGPVAIHPDHRKRGLLSKIIDRHIKSIRDIGYKHICLTTAPNNYPAIRGAMAYGFVIKKLTLKYNNLLRYILHLSLSNPVKHPKYNVRIPNTDIESLKFILGLGFYGYNVLKNENGFDIVFGHDEIKT